MPTPEQANLRQNIIIAESDLPLVHSPKIIGVYLDTFFSFNNHCVQVANRVSKRNNILKPLLGTNCGQQNQTLLMTYKALGTDAEPVWITNASESTIDKIQRALIIITGSHKLLSIDHIHNVTELLQVKNP